MAGDRISEAYEGKLSEAMKINSQKRIDWTCSMIHGQHVLDIGCSQGILAVLAGRNGKTVLGIDNDDEAIKYALNMLENEEDSIKHSVNFVCADFLNYDFCEQRFDTIVIGEVLEHLYKPELFIEKISELLTPDGVVIASVPFGINRHPDHKKTYYFLDLFYELNRFLKVYDVFYMGKWVAMLATQQKNEVKQALSLDEKTWVSFENAVGYLEENWEKDKLSIKQQVDILQALLNSKETEQQRLIIELHSAQQALIKNNEQYESEKEKLITELKIVKNDFTSKLKDKEHYIQKLKQENSELKSCKGYKLQSKYWALKRWAKNPFYKVFYKIKETAKKSQFLCNVVWKYREKTAKKKATTSTNEKFSVIKETIISQMKDEQTASQRYEMFEKGTDRDFFEKIKNEIDKIPESNGGRFYEPHPYKIGIVSDEFLYAAFKDVADFKFITPDNWKDVLPETDFLLMVSAWSGLNEEWRGAAQENHPKRQLIYEIIQEYKKAGKPTVFYSKEDPPNYDAFVGIAKKCDYIFTTCAEVVDKYKRDCNNENVDVICFGINPLYHNPVGMRNQFKKEGVIFSGSWMKKYPERLADMKMLFDGVIEKGVPLKIIDRNYFWTKSENYRYPEEYWKYISPAIEHSVLQKVHKLYNWSININSVTDSMTMFANRCYELQAAGNLLISNYSVGVNSKLPMVFTVTDKFEVGEIISRYSDEDIYRRQTESIRSVMTGETAHDRVGQIIEAIGLKKNENARTVVVVVEKITKHIQEMFNQQTYKYKKLITLDSFTQEILDDSDMVAFFHDKMEYDVFYLEDMINGFKYTAADYITKDAYYSGDQLVEGIEHDYVSYVKNKYSTLFWSKAFNVDELKAFTDSFDLKNGYSIDHFNFNTKYIKSLTTKNYKLSVIIPVYNNGKHLLGKAFSSLHRSSIFNDMEIILVDDGSTDGVTDKYVKYLEHTYTNVKTFLFEDGGSGSASRPRNKGVKLASAEYIIYLDPDDEVIKDSYSILYDEYRKEDFDIVIGNVRKATDKIVDINHYKTFVKKYGSSIVEDDAENYLVRNNFFPINIQAMIIKKQIITDNNLVQIVGAAGEDSIYFYELLYNAKLIKALDETVFIYYAKVEGSTTNTINSNFFQKYALAEMPRRELLEKYAALEDYMRLRFNYYFVNWDLKKLSLVDQKEAEKCTRIVYSIFKIYEDMYQHNDRLINSFIEKCKIEDYKEAYLTVKNFFS